MKQTYRTYSLTALKTTQNICKQYIDGGSKLPFEEWLKLHMEIAKYKEDIKFLSRSQAVFNKDYTEEIKSMEEKIKKNLDKLNEK